MVEVKDPQHALPDELEHYLVQGTDSVFKIYYHKVDFLRSGPDGDTVYLKTTDHPTQGRLQPLTTTLTAKQAKEFRSLYKSWCKENETKTPA